MKTTLWAICFWLMVGSTFGILAWHDEQVKTERYWAGVYDGCKQQIIADWQWLDVPPSDTLEQYACVTCTKLIRDMRSGNGRP